MTYRSKTNGNQAWHRKNYKASGFVLNAMKTNKDFY